MRWLIVSALVLLAAAASDADRFRLVDYSSASVNEFMDKMLDNLRPFVIINDLDPWTMEPYSVKINFTILWTVHEAIINLERWHVMGISTVERHGDCVLNYALGILDIKLDLIVNEFIVDGYGNASVLFYEYDGNMKALVTDQIIKLRLNMDFRMGTIRMTSLAMPNDGEMVIDLPDGSFIEDIILLLVDTFMKDYVISKVSDTMYNMIGSFLDGLQLLPPMPTNTTVSSLFL